jgi:hypothetical protein
MYLYSFYVVLVLILEMSTVALKIGEFFGSVNLFTSPGVEEGGVDFLSGRLL